MTGRHGRQIFVLTLFLMYALTVFTCHLLGLTFRTAVASTLHLLPTLSMTSCARRRSGWKAGTWLLCQKRVLRQRWRIIRILCSNLLHLHCLAGGLSRLHNNSYVHAACRLTSAANHSSPSQLHELCWRPANAVWTMPRIWRHLISAMAYFRVLGVELLPSSSVGNHVLDHRQQVTL